VIQSALTLAFRFIFGRLDFQSVQILFVIQLELHLLHAVSLFVVILVARFHKLILTEPFLTTQAVDE